ncbi:MAG: hypothetical protein ACR2OG_08030 [Gemmatimonadaceae bacterium]
MATAVAAVIALKERQLVQAFVLAGATSPPSAQTLESLHLDASSVALRRLRERAVLREAAPGRFYADIEVWQAVRRTRRRMVLVLALGLLFAMLAFGLIGAWHPTSLH